MSDVGDHVTVGASSGERLRSFGQSSATRCGANIHTLSALHSLLLNQDWERFLSFFSLQKPRDCDHSLAERVDAFTTPFNNKQERKVAAEERNRKSVSLWLWRVDAGCIFFKKIFKSGGIILYTIGLKLLLSRWQAETPEKTWCETPVSAQRQDSSVLSSSSSWMSEVRAFHSAWEWESVRVRTLSVRVKFWVSV